MAEQDIANVRRWCIIAFGSIGPAAASAVPFLIDLLLKKVCIDPNTFYVSMAAETLGNIGSVEALPSLLLVLRETADPDVASQVAESIGKLGSEDADAESLLLNLVSDSAWSIPK
jgi:HEAT repeat protein